MGLTPPPALMCQVLGGLEGVSVATGSGALLDRGALQAAAGAPYAAVWSVSAIAGFHSTARLAALAAAVAPGGQLRVQEPKQVRQRPHCPMLPCCVRATFHALPVASK